jgi:DNA mismatch repair protein MutL
MNQAMARGRRIRILPDRLVNQIAAGEVVERPASVVKELTENALDAGASRIEISVRNGGKTEIRVMDDGCGMGREDALLSLDRHATSKINDMSDLAAVRTLGFRGEALPSIASVARVTLETAERDEDGTRLVISGGQLAAVEGCARRRGTTVTVRNLFFNVPARAKFLRSVAVETRAVSETVTTLALAHPEVAFRLDSNGRELLQLDRAPDLRSRIAAIWGQQSAEQLIGVVHREGAVVLTGLVQRPRDATRGGRRAYLFINGRPFVERSLLRAADRGYRTTVAPGVHPSLFLFLEVPEGAVDVNVHPAKAEVRFRDATAVEQVVEEGIRAALRPLDSAPSIGRSVPVAEVLGAADRTGPHEQAAPDAVGGPALSAPAEHGSARSAEPAPQMSLFVASVANDAGTAADAGAEERRPVSQPTMWQVHNTYIFAETRTGLIIVDQHSAHERVLYEEMMRGFADGGQPSQRLLFPLTLRLSPAECALVDELSSLLTQAGFEVEPFGGRSIIIHAVPHPHPYFDAERCLREMVAELTQGSPLVDAARNQHQRIALSFACKAAIKAGQRLSPAEMSELFDRLFATELPYHDIHGRPTVVQLSLPELHSRFGRHG